MNVISSFILNEINAAPLSLYFPTSTVLKLNCEEQQPRVWVDLIACVCQTELQDALVFPFMCAFVVSMKDKNTLSEIFVSS